MPPPPTPLPAHSIIQLRFQGRIFEQLTINTFYYKWDAGADGPNYITELRDGFLSNLEAAGQLYDVYRKCLSASWVCDAMYVQPVYPTRLAAIFQVPAETQGALIDADLPVNTAATVERRGATADRHSVGAVHLPAQVVTSLDAVSNDWTDGHYTRLSTFGGQLPIAIDGTGFTTWQPVLVQGDFDNPPVFITDFKVQRSPRVMRRRTKGIGK